MFNQNIITSDESASLLSDVCRIYNHFQLLNFVPASSFKSHAHISTSNQQPINRTKSRPTVFVLIIQNTQIHLLLLLFHHHLNNIRIKLIRLLSKIIKVIKHNRNINLFIIKYIYIYILYIYLFILLKYLNILKLMYIYK